MKFSTAAAVSATFAAGAEAAVSMHFLGRLTRDAPESGVDVKVEVVKKEPFKSESKSSCICPEGTFWHSRINECIAKGGLGYECGFFPSEHHESVCKDGFTCRKLDDTPIKYFHKGAVPASCQPCKAEDKCEKEDRTGCTKAVSLSGEACATVRITARPKGAVSESETESHSATAKYTATAEASATLFGEGGVAITKTASAECTESATVTAEAKAKGSAKENGVAEKRVCVSVVDALTHAGHSKDLKMGEKTAKEVAAVGEQMALDGATATAKKAAEHLASEQSEEAAEKEAEKDANAEAQKEAVKKAEAEAQAKAEKCARELAERKAKEAAKAAYDKLPASTTAAASTAAPTTTAATSTSTSAAPSTSKVAATTTAATTQAPGALLPGPPPQKVEPAKEPEIPARRKVSAEEAAAELP